MAKEKILSKEEILHLAKLANISLTEAEVITYAKQLSEVLTYIEQLNEVDTSQIEATTSTIGLSNILRDDEMKNDRVFKSLDTLKTIKKNDNQYFKVNRIME